MLESHISLEPEVILSGFSVLLQQLPAPISEGIVGDRGRDTSCPVPHVLRLGQATPYARDLKNIEIHMLDTGHFALETHGEEIGSHIESFFLKRQSKAA